MRQNFPYVGAVYLLLFQDNRILLHQRAHSAAYRPGEYSVPAGHMEGHELATEAMIREASEELGITIHPERLEEPLTLFRICHDKDNERFELFFPLTDRDGEIVNNEPDKCYELAWFPIDALPDMTIPYIREVIQAWQSGKKFLEIRE